MSNDKKQHKVVTDSDYVPIHAIGGYLSQLGIKKKREKHEKKKHAKEDNK
ncbi:hypothetical protein ACWCL1_00805 [Ligilactobacillus sp. LYQ135]